MGDHVVIPQGHGSQYPYGERMPYEEAPNPDPIATLSFIGGKTKTLRLGTSVLILPQRNPVVLAKQVATLDVLSGGRVDLGVGVGWLREEFAAIGVPWERRGRRTDEYIEGDARALDAARGELRGRAGALPERRLRPAAGAARRRPDQHRRPHHGGRAARRPPRRRLLPERLRPLLARADRGDAPQRSRGRARPPSEVAIMGGTPPELEIVQKLAERGVSRVNILVNDPDVPSARRMLERISRDVIARV